MDDIVQQTMRIGIVFFMVFNLLEVGLRLEISEAVAALGNVRFDVISLLCCFLLGPSLAVLLTNLIPLSEGYALGLVLLGMSPCSPAIPIMVRKAGGNLAYLSAFMLLAFAGTMAFMPFMVPLLVKGFSTDPWTIGRPLVFLIAIPLAIGMAIRHFAGNVAEQAAPVVKKVTSLNTIILCATLLWLYGSDLIGAVGAYAIGSQILYYALLGLATYLLGSGLSYDQKVPMVLGVCTRNVGPAIAPLFAVTGAPEDAVTMCILAIFVGAILSGFVAAAILRHFCSMNDANSQSS